MMKVVIFVIALLPYFNLHGQEIFKTPLINDRGAEGYFVLFNKHGDTIAEFYRYSWRTIKMSFRDSLLDLKKRSNRWYLITQNGQDTLALSWRRKYIRYYYGENIYKIIKVGSVYRLFEKEGKAVASCRFEFKGDRFILNLFLEENQLFNEIFLLFWANMLFIAPEAKIIEPQY